MKHFTTEEIDTQELLQHVAEISRYERISGSKEEWQAFLYCQEQLLQAGFEVEILKHPAYISVPQQASLKIDGHPFPCKTHAMGGSTPESGITADLIYCDSISDISVERCRNKIVVLRDRANFGPVQRAKQAGAVAFIAVQDVKIRECIPSAAWGSPTRESSSLLPHLPVVSVLYEDVKTWFESLKQTALAAADDPPNTPQAEILTAVTTDWINIPLLSAWLRAPESATDDQTPFVMLSAHLDSWYLGAMDNGTANAVQLGFASYIAQNRHLLRRDLRIVMYSGHSQGRYAGSSWLADQEWLLFNQRCLININMDSLGGEGNCDYNRTIIMEEARSLARLIIEPITGQPFTGKRSARMADQSFWICGTTAAFASLSKQPLPHQAEGNLSLDRGNFDLGWYWHTPEDTIQHVDPNRLNVDARIFYAYTLACLNEKRIPLDFRESMQIIRQTVELAQQTIQPETILDGVQEKARQVETTLNELYQTEDDDLFNRKLFAVSRHLVWLNYVDLDLYINAPTLPQKAVPCLSAAFAYQQADARQKPMIITELHKKKNYLLHHFDAILTILKPNQEE